jgi:hypothetical protein
MGFDRGAQIEAPQRRDHAAGGSGWAGALGQSTVLASRSTAVSRNVTHGGVEPGIRKTPVVVCVLTPPQSQCATPQVSWHQPGMGRRKDFVPTSPLRSNRDAIAQVLLVIRPSTRPRRQRPRNDSTSGSVRQAPTPTKQSAPTEPRTSST